MQLSQCLSGWFLWRRKQQVCPQDHGRRKDFFQGGPIADFSRGRQKDFSRGRQKLWNFILTNRSHENNLFCQKFNRKISNFKIQGSQGLLPPFFRRPRTGHVSMFIWQKLVIFTSAIFLNLPCRQIRSQVRSHGGIASPNTFCAHPNFVVPRKMCFKHIIKTKVLHL